VSWAEIFLGIIAVATLSTAVIQIGVLVAAGRLLRRLERVTDRVEQELKPIFGNLNSVAREVSRAATLAAGQVERADALVANLTHRSERALKNLESSFAAPAREGAAVLRGFQAAMEAFRTQRPNRGSGRTDDEDALFI
jgi:hypothetical protein